MSEKIESDRVPAAHSTPPGARPHGHRRATRAVSLRLRAGAAALVLALGCIGREPGAVAPSGNDSAGASSDASSGPGDWKPVREPAWGQERSARTTKNLFSELLGKSQAEVDAKVTTAVNRFFGIGTGEAETPVKAEGYRVYYELPQDRSMAFIWAADSNDVRSEGMSYGMLIALQMDMRPEFDRLWKFARTHMQYASDANPRAWRHYFRWQGKVDTKSAPWTVRFGPQTTPAPDGEEYFAAALYLADRRWGSAGEVNYREEAAKISWAMLNNPATGDKFPLIHRQSNMVVFVPYASSNEHSDPSYHLPAFYELFAEYGPAGDAERWREIAKVSRDYLVKSAHPSTGLHPDYALFTGAPTQGYQASKHDEFYYDAWRVVMNMALDQTWFGADARMKAQVEKYHGFFANHVEGHNVSAALFKIDGSGPSGGGSTALTATLASGSLVSEAPTRKLYVENLWHVGQQAGEYRYYQECVYLLGLLAVAGRYNYDWPAPPAAQAAAQ
jgi:oligosaccharide reducing-end xylanase